MEKYILENKNYEGKEIKNLFGGHLHAHTEYSIQDAPNKISDALKRAKELGYTFYAITDHATIQGWPNFDIECKKLNIKGIFGYEGYEKASTSLLENETLGSNVMYHSLFFAKNQKGISFLRKLATHAGKLENRHKGRKKEFNMYQLEFLVENKDLANGNVILLTACIQGRLPSLLRNGKESEAKKYIDIMTDVFGKENVFIELQDHNLDEEKISNELCIKFANKYGYELVATNDVHYIDKEDYEAREMIIARSFGLTWEEHKERNLKRNPNGFLDSLYIKSKEEMAELFGYIPQALANSQKIADMCEVINLEEKEWHYPNIDIPEGHTAKSYYRKLCYDNLPKKLPVNSLKKEEYNQIIDRLEYEIDVIDKMNSSAYMLIDQDFIVWAKNNGIVVGPGRGSACGSLSAYLTGITDINPLDYTLLFERFMSPERVTMPDYQLIGII